MKIHQHELDLKKNSNNPLIDIDSPLNPLLPPMHSSYM